MTEVRSTGTPPVSEWFQLDWQYVLWAGRFPAFKPLTVVLAIWPILSDVTAIAPRDSIGFWLIWTGSLATMLAFGITGARCPTFIWEYEKFKDYEDRGHSHRFIGWLFYLNRGRYPNLEKVIREAIEKGISIPASTLTNESEFAACPIMEVPPASHGAFLQEPVNINRDLYVCMWIDGQRYLIALQETDPAVNMKIKELFWIMFSSLVSSRKRSRIMVWCLYCATGLLFALALGFILLDPALDLAVKIDRLIDRFLWGCPI